MSEFSDLLTGEFTVWGVTVQNWMLLANGSAEGTVGPSGRRMTSLLAHEPMQNPFKADGT
jgi:hypothetical protein